MSANRIPINEYDLAGITNEVNVWQSHDKFASYDISRRNQGIATMILENLFTETTTYVVFEIHKFGKKGFWGSKSFWVIQLYSSETPEGPFVKHGCIPRKTLVKAIIESQRDVKYGFLSSTDFDLALGAMLE